jgi:diguanylate cyclase (GGDEF)-like protein
MQTNSLNYLMGYDFKANLDDINRENRMAIRYLAIAGIPVSLAVIAAQTAVRGVPALSDKSFLMLGYFALLLLADRLIIPLRCRHTIPLIYLLQAPVLIVAILLGTVWDPTHQALTFLMLMMVMPALILDRPIRVIAVTLFWYALFLVLCYTIKDPGTRRGDTMHAVEFLCSSGLVNYVVHKVRFRELHALQETRYRLTHDDLTGLRSLDDLRARSDAYVQKPVMIVVGDLDNLSIYNDYYGRAAGDRIICAFAAAMRDAFGEEHSFRIANDELLAVVPDMTEAQAGERMAACRAALQASALERRPATLTCTFGYVSGQAENAEEGQNMIHLASIYAHKAGRKGVGETFGAPYDSVELRNSVAESGVNGQARYFERNQLTDLPLVSYFIPRSEELLRELISPEYRCMVGVISMTRLREYNEAFGYVQGDKLIRRVSELIAEAFPQHLVTYVTGARFDLLCYEAEIAEGMEKLCRSMEGVHPGWTLPIKAGFADCKRGDDISVVLDQARHAYKHAKLNKNAVYYYYDAAMDAEDHLRQYVADHVEEAVERGWHEVWFQPIVSAGAGEICAMEALSRWNDPQYGMLSPAKFVPPLEDARLVWKLSLNVVRCAIAALRAMEEAGLTPVPISINLSRHDFFDCDIVSEIISMSEAAGCDRALLRIELTESAFAENQSFLTEQVERLRAAGFGVWMDDFGSGYSSLNILQSLNVDLVKLDMAFVKDFCGSWKNAVIVSEIVTMCRRLGMKTLVEGVETQEQLACMRKLSCDMLQGFYFSRPCPLPEALEKLKQPEKAI